MKAHAGILESDDLEAAGAKLEQTVPEGIDREWMAQRLLPLVGVDMSSQAEREELFAAWRGFLETVAEQTPTVLVFEDLHWADDGMLAFLEHLADRAEGVPLLVVGTARPELFERHSLFAAGLHNVNRINLAPLTDEETALLISSLLELRDPGRAPAAAHRTLGGQPPLCRGVRAPLAGPGPARPRGGLVAAPFGSRCPPAGFHPGAHRRAPGHPSR